jgi:hypothetical protein
MHFYVRNLKILMNISLFLAILHFYTSILMCTYVTYIFTKLHRNFRVKSFIRSLFGRKLQCSYIVKFLVQITLKFGFIGYPPALAISYYTSYHSTIATTPFEQLFGEKARLLSFPNKDIQQIHYGETSAAERFYFLQRLRAKAHQFATEHGLKSKTNFYKNASDHKFKIGNKVLISNDFYTRKILN